MKAGGRSVVAASDWISGTIAARAGHPAGVSGSLSVTDQGFLCRFSTSASSAASSESTSGRSEPEVSQVASKRNQWAWRAGAVGLFAATGIAASYALDDLLTFNKCRSQAMEVAAADARLQQILGDDIGSGPWYEGSLGRGHSGHSASCSFPISGSRGSATLQLKAIRFDGGSTLYYNLVGPGRWEVLMLDAEVARPKDTVGAPPNGPSKVRINLMQGDDGPRAGDSRRGDCLPCSNGDRGLTVT